MPANLDPFVPHSPNLATFPLLMIIQNAERGLIKSKTYLLLQSRPPLSVNHRRATLCHNLPPEVEHGQGNHAGALIGVRGLQRKKKDTGSDAFISMVGNTDRAHELTCPWTYPVVYSPVL
jgi:hypothetical protein